MHLRCKTAALLVGMLGIALPIAAGATPLVSATLDDSPGYLLMTFHNEGLTSSDDIVSIVLDGSTAEAFPICWDYAGFPIGPPGADVQIVGENTQILTITFSDASDGFNPGESFVLEYMDPDGDPGPAGVALEELIGIGVFITTRDEAPTFEGSFEQEEAGTPLVLVPEPANGALLLLGLTGLVLAGHRGFQPSSAKRSRSTR